jgi:predicted deacylase
MTSKRVVKLPVEDRHNNVKSFIPLGVVEGRQRGPTLAVLGGVHASEYAARNSAVRFWESLDPEQISGRVLVVLAADVTAFQAHHIYTNPVDGKNLNRIYPGDPDGTLSEVIVHTLMEEVISHADAVIDCHGGEFDEYMGFYLIAPLTGEEDTDHRTLGLAHALGFPFIETTDASGKWLGRGTMQAEAVRRGIPAMAIEVGQCGEEDEQATAAGYNALRNALKHLGMIEGQPVPWAGQPVRLEAGAIVLSKEGGVFKRNVMVGDWVQEGELLGRIYDFDDTLLEEIRAPEAGIVLTVISSPAIRAGAFVGKIGVLPEGATLVRAAHE